MVSDNIRKIDSILGRIRVHPEYSSVVEREARVALQGDAAKHSLDLEIREKGSKGGELRKKTANALHNLHEAWYHLATEGVSLTSLSRLGGIIEPKPNNMSFRHEDVDIGEVPPVDWEKVYYEVDSLATWMNFTNVHPITRGINAHLETSRIHPWVDGNGRGARLIQSFAFEERGIPPAVIYSSDFEIYKRMLRDTLKDRAKGESSYDHPSKREMLFHSYVDGRVLASAEHLEDELRKKRHYDVVLKRVKDKSKVIKVASTIRSLGRRPDSDGVKAHIDKKGSASSYRIQVVGDVGLSELREALGGACKKYGVKVFGAEVVKGCFGC